MSEPPIYVHILTLDNGNWELVVEGDTFVHAEMSPIEHAMMFDGLYIMPFGNKPLKAKFPGYNGVWSRDGTKIAFLRQGPGTVGVGIAQWDSINTPHWRWLYEPQPPNEHYYLDIGGNDYRILSWSLDGRYLAFVAKRAMYDSQIFRLDVATGEIVILTTKFAEKRGYHPSPDYYAPAWGP